MKPPWIPWVDETDATGELKQIYEQWFAANPGRKGIPEILKCFSSRPDLLNPILALTYPLQFNDGNLDRTTKEMLATYVSGLNECDY